MTEHNKRTHDALVDRVADALRERYGHNVKTNVEYEQGEIDIAVYNDETIKRYYEVKSNDLWCNYTKGVKQINRFLNYKEGTVKREEMSTERRGIYVSQKEIGGEFSVERIV